MIYFDNAATTYPKPEEVYVAMDKFYREFGVNAGRGTYNHGRITSDMIEDTRRQLARLFKISKPQRVIFFPSATIALNQVLQGIQWNSGDVVYYSPFEHNGTLRVLYRLEKMENIVLKQIPVDLHTLSFDLEILEQNLASSPPRLVIVSHVSNVCGVIAPVDKIALLAHNYGSEIMVDAAQCAGLIPVVMDNIDYYVFAGHKSLYGPLGIAGLVVNKESVRLEPLILGGTGSQSESKEMPENLPKRYEVGSMNIQAIAGLNSALKWIECVTPEKIFEHDKLITRELVELFRSFMDIRVFIPKNMDEHFNVVSMVVTGYTPQEVGKILDEKFDIATRTGFHCSPLAHKILGTELLGTVRFSVGYFNNKDEVLKLRENFNSFIF